MSHTHEDMIVQFENTRLETLRGYATSVGDDLILAINENGKITITHPVFGEILKGDPLTIDQHNIQQAYETAVKRMEEELEKSNEFLSVTSGFM